MFFALKDSAPRGAACRRRSYQVRKKIGDIRNTLPAGIQGPFFNDEFGDTYTNIYALTGDGFGYRELKEFGDRVRAELLRVPGVAKVDFIGEQEEKIFVELSNAQARARSASSRRRSSQTLARAERGRARPGVFDTATDRIYLRPTGAFDSRRRDPRHRDPRQQPRVPPGRHRDGRRAATSIRRSRRCAGTAARRSASASRWSKGGDVIELGRDARRARSRASQQQLPVGVEIAPVASMPRAVQRSINQFVRSLAEAVLDRARGVAA